MIFRRLSFYLALAGVAAGFFLVRRLREVPPAPAPLAEPARSPYADFVAASGILEARGENVAVAAPRAGLVMRVLVEVGSDVKAGDPLVELDRREALARVETARAQLSSLEAARTVERVVIEDWSDQYARIRRLERDEVATEDERKRKEFALEAAKARLARLDADSAAAGAQIRQAEVELEVLTVRAPREGRVLQLNVRAGEATALGQDRPLLVLGDVRRYQVRADVDEQNAPMVETGRAGVAFLKGDRERRMPLEFVRIEPYVVPKRSLTGDSAERVDTRVLQIIFLMDPPPFAVYVGQQVDVFIERPTGSAAANDAETSRSDRKHGQNDSETQGRP